MVKIYNCSICGRNVTAHTTHDVIKKVRRHGLQIHNISVYSPMQLHAIKQKMENLKLD